MKDRIIRKRERRSFIFSIELWKDKKPFRILAPLRIIKRKQVRLGMTKDE